MTNINGYESYKVSEEGKIYKDLGHRIVEIKPCLNSWGYLVFSMSINGNRKMFKVHRIVAEHYVANPDPAKFDQVNHIDGNKRNNAASNLEWIDNKKNNEHKVLSGLAQKSNKRISEEVKQKILQEHLATRKGSCVLAKQFGVSINTAFRIIKDY